MSMNETTPQLLTVREACAWSGIARSTQYRRFIGTGMLEVRKIGTATRIVLSELAEVIANLPKGGE